MKTTFLFAHIFTVFGFALPSLAATTEFDTAKELKNGASETIVQGDEWKFLSGSSLLVENSVLNVDGTITNVGATTFRFDSRNSTGSVVTFDGGKFLNENTAGTTNIIVGQDTNTCPLLFELKNGASIGNNPAVSGVKNLDIEFGRNTDTTINIDKTSSITATTINYSTRGWNASPVVNNFNINGGTVSLSNNLNVATAGQLANNSGILANISINGGGRLTTLNATILNQAGKADNEANRVFVTVKDIGSSFSVSNNLSLGPTSVENSESVAELILHTGASATVGATLTVNNHGAVRAVLDSDTISSNAPLLSTNNASLYNNSGADAAFVIDGELLGASGSFEKDMTYDFVLFEVKSGQVGLNGTSKSMSDADFLDDISTFISFENNTGNSFWKDFGVDDLFVVDGNRIGVSLTYAVPEPGAYAAIFGALALFLAACRRRK